jgi:hypothetical protein
VVHSPFFISAFSGLFLIQVSGFKSQLSRFKFQLSTSPISALIQVSWVVSKHDDWRPDSGCLPDQNWNLLQFILR